MTGYNDIINYNTAINYNGGAITIDTHDPQRRKIFLPIYINTKRKVQYKTAIKKLPKGIPKEIKAAITSGLISYDIDWLAVSSYAKESGERIDSIIFELEEMGRKYDRDLQEEDELMIMAIAALESL